MQLYEFLNYISTNCPVNIFDINGVKIASATSKKDLSSEFFEYSILEVAAGKYSEKLPVSSIYVQIQK